MNSKRPVMLMILDGWGNSAVQEGNAVAQADPPFLRRLSEEYPTTRLLCSGEAVGLPPGVMGNSEVGHLNIGAGRIVYQDLMRINKAIEDGSLWKNPTLTDLMDRVIQAGSTLHLAGLVSDGGVHSDLDHLLALLEMAKERGVPRTAVHAITDGRDTSPTSGVQFVKTVVEWIRSHQYGEIATICGRYFAMDRDQRWDRTERAYRLLTRGEGRPETNPVTAVRDAYERGETDEFIPPVAMTDESGSPLARVKKGDGFFFFNFRADRARQLARAFTEASFAEFDRGERIPLTGFATMTRYDAAFDLPAAFPPVQLKGILGEVVAKAGKRQLRIAETEKYAHVTYFFNGGEETPFPGEERVLIPSPREVATYDAKPEMSAPEVTEAVLERLSQDRFDLIVLNFANMDMVGHTGDIEAAVAACKTVDRCAERIVGEVLKRGGAVAVTSDHGNAEMMRDAAGNVHTAHTLNPAPFILVDDDRKSARLAEGKLGDIAPTLLELMGVAQPDEMTGRSLLNGQSSSKGPRKEES
ncbi:MAG: 2,3-bisphosphoglycerate-independent phosphoglycerate mutase [Desulfococcaceae bacterium]